MKLLWSNVVGVTPKYLKVFHKFCIFGKSLQYSAELVKNLDIHWNVLDEIKLNEKLPATRENRHPVQNRTLFVIGKIIK